MKNEGWSYGDLAGELMERGIDIDCVNVGEYLDYHKPERAADAIEQAMTPPPTERRES